MLGDHKATWVVRLNGPDCEGVGLVSIKRHHDFLDDEVSYEFLPAVWGTGIATEALGSVLGYAFKHLGYQRLIAETQVANLPSRRLLERVGMVHEREVLRFGVDQVIYATAGNGA